MNEQFFYFPQLKMWKFRFACKHISLLLCQGGTENEEYKNSLDFALQKRIYLLKATIIHLSTPKQPEIQTSYYPVKQPN